MHRPRLTKWLTLIALLFGAIFSSALMAFVGGGWNKGVLGYVAWALMPYAAMAILHIGLHLFRVHQRVQLYLTCAIMVVALGGPLLYVDAMFVHVDAQGALVVLMVPIIQTALALSASVLAALWERCIRRSAAKHTHLPDIKTSPPVAGRTVPPRFIRLTRTMLVSAIVIGGLLYFLISMLQNSDSAAISSARQVDTFIVGYCENNQKLPTLRVLQAQFANLNGETGWFFFTDDKTYLRMQYPIKWWNRNAIGERRISAFTATPYAYVVEYRCKKAK